MDTNKLYRFRLRYVLDEGPYQRSLCNTLSPHKDKLLFMQASVAINVDKISDVSMFPMCTMGNIL